MLESIPHREAWPEEFRQIALRLREGLGSLGLRIDHISTTSVPGLPARDILDIQVTVHSLDDRLVAALRSPGYSKPEGIQPDHCPPGPSDG